MDDSYRIYEVKVKAAKEKVAILENELSEVKLKFKKNSKDPEISYALHKVTTKIDAATYELKHCQSILNLNKKTSN